MTRLSRLAQGPFFLIALVALVVAVIGGTYFGKHLLSRISKERFVFWFQLVLAILAVYLIVSTIV